MQEVATDIHFNTWRHTVLLTSSLVRYEILPAAVMKRSASWDLRRITSVSKDHVASVISVDEWAKQETNIKGAASKAPVCTTLYLRSQNYSASYLSSVYLMTDSGLYRLLPVEWRDGCGWWSEKNLNWSGVAYFELCFHWRKCHSLVPRIELGVSGIWSLSSNDRNVQYQPNNLPVCLEATMSGWAFKTIKKFNICVHIRGTFEKIIHPISSFDTILSILNSFHNSRPISVRYILMSSSNLNFSFENWIFFWEFPIKISSIYFTSPVCCRPRIYSGKLITAVWGDGRQLGWWWLLLDEQGINLQWEGRASG
jgi:hypothetical protein